MERGWACLQRIADRRRHRRLRPARHCCPNGSSRWPTKAACGLGAASSGADQRSRWATRITAFRRKMPKTDPRVLADAWKHSQEEFVPFGDGLGGGCQSNTNHGRPPLAKAAPQGGRVAETRTAPRTPRGHNEGSPAPSRANGREWGFRAKTGTSKGYAGRLTYFYPFRSDI